MNSKNIRNFCIIAHVDHGKSTLADRFLELTGTIDPRRMKPQYLDQLELERERGVTIKMAPCRMIWQVPKHVEIRNPKSETLNKFQIPNSKLQTESYLGFSVSDLELANSEYILNLIDTPGHSDFSYEVSRALTAVEGAILLVDATQGIQAQTLANFEKAKKVGLVIIGAVNKIDIASLEQIEISTNELAHLLGVNTQEIFRVSGKTGEGVENLLAAIIKKIPPPKDSISNFQFPTPKKALVFDSLYDEHKGVIAFVRVFGGEYKVGDQTKLIAANEKFKIKEVGYFSPQLNPTNKLSSGDIGYIATGIKDPGKLKIGDTIGEIALAGYREPQPVVFVSLYPDEESQYDDLKAALQKLKLNDASLIFSPDLNEVLGRGFKCGFLGKFHFEITTERLEKEFQIKTISTFPSVAYKIKIKPSSLKEISDREGGGINKQEAKIKVLTIENPNELPVNYFEILEPMIKIEIIMPLEYLNNVLRLKEIFRMENIKTDSMEGKVLIMADMPLSALLADFDNKLKSVSSGMASFSYEFGDYQKAELEKVEILVNGSIMPGLTQLIYKNDLETKPRELLRKLKELLPRQQFSQALQAKAGGKIISRETIPALRKDVTGHLYGGDRTRKMKLWQKQKKGKKKLLQMTKGIKIPAKVFKELLK